jgi:hypothetical protein
MLLSTSITAISNEIAGETFLQFDAINFCDATAGTTHHYFVARLCVFAAHRHY